MNRKRRISKADTDQENQVLKARKKRAKGSAGITEGQIKTLHPDYLLDRPLLPAQRQAAVLRLQRRYGNATVQRLLHLSEEQEEVSPKPIPGKYRRVSTWGKVRPDKEEKPSGSFQRPLSLRPISQPSLSWGIQRRSTLWDKGFQTNTGLKTDSQRSGIDLATTRLRVSRLKVAGRLLREISQQSIPTGLSRQEAQVEGQYSEWLGQSSDKIDKLASEGSSIIEAMRIGSTKRQAENLSVNQQKVQRISTGSTVTNWGSSYPSSSSPGGTGLSFSNLGISSSVSSENLMSATKQMQEMNQSFNLQYLQLQQNMQQENRQFTMMSNIMKTKHDTAKNAINNIR